MSTDVSVQWVKNPFPGGGDDCPNTSDSLSIQLVIVPGPGGGDDCPDDGSDDGDDGNNGDDDDGEDDQPAVVLTESTLTRTTTLPAGAEDVAFHYRVRGPTEGKNATATVVVEGESGHEQAVALSGAADSTGGWTTDSVDVSRFAGETVTVRLRTEGNATLKADYVGFVTDSTGNGIPDAVARMDLKMPTGPPGVWGEPLALEAGTADSDGDGLADSEEVTIEWEIDGSGGSYYLDASVVSARAHPGMSDTDGDGLTDAEERRARTISITTSPEQSRNVSKADSNAAALDVMSQVEVRSDPLVPDTDGDGRSDWREMVNGTDPDVVDTDGDGIRDAEEYAVGEDPTQFDMSPPELVVQSIQVEGIPWKNKVLYEVTYRVTDPSGVDKIAFYKKGNRQRVVPFIGEENTGLVTTTFNFTGYETQLADGVLGPKVNASVVDGHGNAGNVSQRGQNSFARLAKLVGTAKLPGLDELLETAPPEVQALFETVDQAGKAYLVWALAALSGMAYGAGLVFDDLLNLVKQPGEVLDQMLKAFALFAANPKLLLQVPEMLGEAARQAQELQNPFPGTELPSLEEFDLDVRHTLFAAGWYAGGLVGMIGGELLVGLGVGALAKALAHVSTTVAKVMRTYRGAKLFVKGKALGAAKWVYEAARSGLRYLDGDVIAPTVARLTAGKQANVVGLLDDVPASTRQAVADGGQEEPLVAYLKRTGEMGPWVLEGMPDSVANRLVSVGDPVKKRCRF